MVGLFWGPLGVAAAAALVCYFAVAIAAHIRSHDAANLPTPVVIELMAVATVILRAGTL